MELGGFDLPFKLVISLVLSVSISHWFRPSYKPTTIVHVHRSLPFDGWIKLTVVEPARILIRTGHGIFPWGYFMAGFAAGLVMEFGNQMFAS